MRGFLAEWLPSAIFVAIVGYYVCRSLLRSAGTLADAPKVPEPPRLAWSSEHSVIDDPGHFGYRVFTDEFDEEVAAHALLTPLEHMRIQTVLRQQFAEQRIEAPARTLSILMMPHLPHGQVTVTLLLDNSGSLKGNGQRLLFTLVEIIGRALDRNDVAFEILGFTSSGWKGGRSRTRWLDEGRPEMPGRLCDLRHIVYKPFAASWTDARGDLAVLLHDPVLKENVDGEALVWAYRRLIERPEPRRILLFVSDGAPVDDSTLHSNAGWFLERHLRHVIEEIAGRRLVEIAGIGLGTGQHIRDYLDRAAIIGDWADLRRDRMVEIAGLFEPDRIEST